MASRSNGLGPRYMSSRAHRRLHCLLALTLFASQVMGQSSGTFVQQFPDDTTPYFPPAASNTKNGLADNTVFTVPFTSTIKWDTPMSTWTMALFQNKPGLGADAGTVPVTTGVAGSGSYTFSINSVDELASKYNLSISISDVYFLWCSDSSLGGAWAGGGFTSNYFNVSGPAPVQPAPAVPLAAAASSSAGTSQPSSSQVVPASTTPPVPSSSAAAASSAAASSSQPPTAPSKPTASQDKSTAQQSKQVVQPTKSSSGPTTTTSTASAAAGKDKSSKSDSLSTSTSSTSSTSKTEDGDDTESTSTDDSDTTTTTTSTSGDDDSSSSSTSTSSSGSSGKTEQATAPAGTFPGYNAGGSYANPSNSSVGSTAGKKGTSEDDSSSDKPPIISGGAKAGIVIGVVVCLAMLVPAVFYFIRKYGWCGKNSDDEDDRDGLAGNAFTGAYGDSRGSGAMSNGEMEQVSQHNGGSWLGAGASAGAGLAAGAAAGAFAARSNSQRSISATSSRTPVNGSPVERQPTVPFVVANPDTNPYTGTSPQRVNPFIDPSPPRQDGFLAAAAGARQNPFVERSISGASRSYGSQSSPQHTYVTPLQHSSSNSSEYNQWRPSPAGRDSRSQLEEYLRYGDRPPVPHSNGSASPGGATAIHEADPDAAYNPSEPRHDIPDDQRIMIQRFQELEAGSAYPLRTLSNASAPGANKPLPFPIRHPSNASRVAPSTVRSIQELDSMGLI